MPHYSEEFVVAINQVEDDLIAEFVDLPLFQQFECPHQDQCRLIECPEEPRLPFFDLHRNGMQQRLEI